MRRLTRKQLAAYLDVCPDTVTNMVRAERIPPVLEGLARYDLDRLELWLRFGRQEGEALWRNGETLESVRKAGTPQ